MDKAEAAKAGLEAPSSIGNTAAHAEDGANGSLGVPGGNVSEYPDEEFQDYDEEYGDEEYPEEEFEISAEREDYGEGYEGQEDEMLVEDVRTKIREMEEEAEQLRQLQSESEKSSRPSGGQIGTPTSPASADERAEADTRSVYVGQVDYSCTPEELEAHFKPCGTIVRATIMCDHWSGHPKGYAYIEFASKDSVDAAVALNDSVLKERPIKVVAKRTNQPGLGTASRRSRRPYRPYMRSRRPSYRPYSPYYRGRGRSYRGAYRRTRSRYAAY